MKFFRMESEESTKGALSFKAIFLGIVTLLIVGAFLLQMSLGICPVP